MSGKENFAIEAASSKHRKKDVLPLHRELVPLIREWTAGLGKSDPVFPKLRNRKTWLMVRQDLERVGSPTNVGITYKTDEGIADFHAAGHRTHITELLRNGATVPEPREWARHSDVRRLLAAKKKNGGGILDSQRLCFCANSRD